MKKLFFYGVLLALPLLILEGLFRLLPVSNPPYLQPVSAREPIVRHQPNVDYRYSMGWNFSVRTRMHTNNFGYHHLADYRADDPAPLLMVIGDSFVEAQTVDSGKSAAEILHARLRGSGRVYSIGVSGAPLSQYLAFAQYARDVFRPAAIAFFVNQSDFDESLLKYKAEPRFHYFAEGTDGFALRRVDYERSAVRTLLRKSAFVRYVMLNLKAGLLLQKLRSRCDAADPYECLAGSAAALEQRIADAQRAVEHFLDQVQAKSGLQPDAIVFVVDAIRPAMYSPQAMRQAETGYAYRMTQSFKAQAAARGYHVVDLQPAFGRRHRLDGSRFEFPIDGHWNELGHALVAQVLESSPVFVRLFHGQAEGAVQP